jgi:FixJ family two-component response regulator
MKSMRERVVAVVDDDTRVLESLENLLESAGHTVHLFTSAQALLEDEAFSTIDCLISDIGMPTIDGFDLERLARAARPELPVILITGRLELIKGRQVTELGENRTFLLKPFSEQELLGAINEALAPRPRI